MYSYYEQPRTLIIRYRPTAARNNESVHTFLHISKLQTTCFEHMLANQHTYHIHNMVGMLVGRHVFTLGVLCIAS